MQDKNIIKFFLYSGLMMIILLPIILFIVLNLQAHFRFSDLFTKIIGVTLAIIISGLFTYLILNKIDKKQS